MNKTDLIEHIAKNADISKAAATRALEATIGAVKTTLRKGGTVSLVGFGTFAVGKRAALHRPQPRTGATIKIKSAKGAEVPSRQGAQGCAELSTASTVFAVGCLAQLVEQRPYKGVGRRFDPVSTHQSEANSGSPFSTSKVPARGARMLDFIRNNTKLLMVLLFLLDHPVVRAVRHRGLHALRAIRRQGGARGRPRHHAGRVGRRAPPRGGQHPRHQPQRRHQAAGLAPAEVRRARAPGA